MPVLEKIISLVAPHYCLVCGAEGALLCGYCSYDLSSVPSRCYRCQRVTKDSKVCSNCRKNVYLKQVWVRTLYQDDAKQALHAYKFERARSAYKPLADAVLSVLPHMPDDTVVVPVPTATAHIRLRGYDHALLLAQEIAKQRHLVYEQALTRLSQSRQVGATRKQRFDQLKNAFIVTKPKTIKNKTILLVDDITTTGATLETTAVCLGRAGAKRINAVVFAQRI